MDAFWGFLGSLFGGVFVSIYNQHINNRNNKVEHDRILFTNIEKIISNEEIDTLIYNSKNYEYLIKMKWDDLSKFVNQTANKFISDNKLNNLLTHYNNDMSQLASWYAHNSSYDLENEIFKLPLSDLEESQKDRILNECGRLTHNLERSYNSFRSEIKKQLII